jgi:hypothetical protein
MHWNAPSEKDTATGTLGKRLWDAADQFRPMKCEVRTPKSSRFDTRHSSFFISLGPACGSGPAPAGFVSSARFVAEHKREAAAGDSPSLLGGERAGVRGGSYPRPSDGRGAGGEGYSGDPARELSIHGVEKTDKTRRCDFVLAKPSLNVNAMDHERLKDSVGPGCRFPFGLPRTDNANYLRIQLFHSALNEKGRAGFVMVNSAPDARASGVLLFEDEFGGKLEVSVADLITRCRRKCVKQWPLLTYFACCHEQDPSGDVALAGVSSTAAVLHREGILKVIAHFGPLVFGRI